MIPLWTSTMTAINNIVVQLFVKKYTGHINFNRSFVTKKVWMFLLLNLHYGGLIYPHCIVNKVSPIMQPQPMKKEIVSLQQKNIPYDFSQYV